MAITSLNPATGKVVKTFEPLGERELEQRLERATRAFRAWRTTARDERAARLGRAAEVLDAENEAWGRLMDEEMGKTIRAARAEIEKCAWAFRHYAQHGARMLDDEVLEGGRVTFLPLGAVLAVM